MWIIPEKSHRNVVPVQEGDASFQFRNHRIVSKEAYLAWPPPQVLITPQNQQLLAWLPSDWFFGLFQQLNGSLRVTALREVLGYLAATRRSLFLLAVAPVLVATAVVLFPIWPLRSVLEHLIVLWLLGTILADLCLQSFPKIPFTCSHLPGKANLQFAFRGFALIFIIAINMGAQFELQAFQSLFHLAVMLIILAITASSIKWRTIWRARSQQLIFEEEQSRQVFSLELYRY